MGKIVKLNQIVGTYSPEKGIYNSYNYYRDQAKKYGTVNIAGTDIPAHKEKGCWWIDLDEYDRAIKESIKRKDEEKERLRLMFQDYQKRIFHPGRIWISDYRYYENSGDFRLEVDIYQASRKDCDGVWYCNTCNLPAETEHNNPECHTCADWGSCGRDCTLSKVYCSHCKKTLIIS